MKTNDGWEYIDNTIGDSLDIKFEIIPPASHKKCPATLFKYYALNFDNVDALRKSYLYASYPEQLNDPYDCHHELIEYSIKDKENIKNILSNECESELNETQALIRYNNRKFQHFGVISMTTQSVNTLMWAHYSKNSGFMLEFDYNKFDKAFFGPFPINYTENFEAIITNKLPYWSSFLRQTNVKSEVWKYEEEWRFIAHSKEPMHIPSIDEKDNFEKDRKFKYNNSLKSITLGSLFFGKENFTTEKGIKVKLSGLQLCIVQFALQNNIDLYWIVNPSSYFKLNNGFKLLRKKIKLNKLDEMCFELIIIE